MSMELKLSTTSDVRKGAAMRLGQELFVDEDRWGQLDDDQRKLVQLGALAKFGEGWVCDMSTLYDMGADALKRVQT